MHFKRDTFSLLIFYGSDMHSFPLVGSNSFRMGRRSMHVQKEYVEDEAGLKSAHYKADFFEGDCEISIAEAHVSVPHGRFFWDGHGWYYLELGSSNGTYYNGQKIRMHQDGAFEPILLKAGDVLDIRSPDPNGRIYVRIRFFIGDIANDWNRYSMKPGQSVRIGRGESNDIVFSEANVSRKHAVIQWYKIPKIQDIGSGNGTFHNGKRLEEHVDSDLAIGDVIQIGRHYIVLGMDALYLDELQTRQEDTGKDHSSKLMLRAYIKRKKVDNLEKAGPKKKELLRDIRLDVMEGTLVALLGSSGAGKTTVMNCLNGMDTIGMEGKILFEGRDLVQHFDQEKFKIGSVPQGNVFHEELIVRDELMDAARLRLPHYRPEQIKNRVDTVMKELGLTHVANNRISLCSGGEQKRINIGIDLVADKKLLCLDEPDAGLDPGMKRELFQILQKLARKGKKSILVIIHDVSEMDLFDQVIIMTKYQDIGRLAFSGSPEEAKQYFQIRDLKEVYPLLNAHPERYVQ